MTLTWVSFERAVKFTAAMVWATWEVMVRQEPNPERLVFIFSVLAGSEGIKLIAAATSKKEETEG